MKGKLKASNALPVPTPRLEMPSEAMLNHPRLVEWVEQSHRKALNDQLCGDQEHQRYCDNSFDFVRATGEKYSAQILQTIEIYTEDGFLRVLWEVLSTWGELFGSGSWNVWRSAQKCEDGALGFLESRSVESAPRVRKKGVQLKRS
jgi:hypothetical protein